jgi:hypothetical protein
MCTAEAPRGVYSTKQRAVAALKTILLTRILRNYSPEDLSESCPGCVHDTSPEESPNCEWRLTPDADILRMYTQSGQEEADQEAEESRWTYELKRITVDVEQDCEEDKDEYEENAEFLLAPENRKRKNDSAEESSAKKAKPASASE